MPPISLITGITGQDGSYLTELLIRKGHVVHGLVRRSSSTQRARLDPLFFGRDVYGTQLFLHYADLDDITTIRRILVKTQPDELYHLAGQSHVGASFEIPESTCQFTAMGTLRLLEVIRDLEKKPRFLNISSSEIFGAPEASPQDEQTPMRPVSPYGVAKTFATHMTRIYRESFGIFACNAICYNHESPRRGESFVTRKITRAAVAISLGLQYELLMGPLESRRDWGYAPEYVEAMWSMVQQSQPEDFVIATGRTVSLKYFVERAFQSFGLDWNQHVVSDNSLLRPSDIRYGAGSPARALYKLGWRSTLDVDGVVDALCATARDALQKTQSSGATSQ